MFKSKYTFTFIIVTFFLLSITGAGIFVDDEWTSAQQLKQLGSGQQIITNEGGYGYYANGTIGNYFDYRYNKLMYTMALPIASLPVYEIIKLSGEHTRFLYIIAWTLCGILISAFLSRTKRITTQQSVIWISTISLLTLVNIYLYNSFPVTGKFIPSEVLAIVTTNIVLFGLLAVFIHKTIDRLFEDNIKLKAFAFITTLSCSSLIFWVGTCKDHILSVLIGIIILYYLIKYEQDKSLNSLSIALFLTGLLTWVRVEFGAGMLLGITIYLLLYHYKNILSNKFTLGLVFLVGTIPTWINNYITTGSPFLHPFIAANYAIRSRTINLEEEVGKVMNVGWSHPIESIFHLLISPESGAVGLLIIIPLVLIVITAYLLRRTKLSQTDILLLIITFASSSFYIINSAVWMHADLGIMPDMRYFIFFYTSLTLFMLSILTKILPNLKYKKMIIYYVLFVGLFFILFTAYSSTLSDDGTYRDMNRIVNTISALLMGIGIIAIVNDIRLNKQYINYILPLLIAIPMAWQLIMLFVYHTSKSHFYPMFIPITEFIYNNVFGLIL